MTSLAVKYRPKTIAELKGQNAIEKILSAAFKNERIAPAYILTGIRGVGKTTTARILARALNCQQGPTLTPCGECASCKAIDNDVAMDVIEMDAASHTGVEQMRDLIANVAYAPMLPGARKIYIIDEVHMLSTSSFNALLKTLEEPPAHVIFILATTEFRKIPVTIVSRCQTLSLARIPLADIKENLETIASKEGSQLQAGVSTLIARAATGSMRDGISMLDQSISGATGEVTLEDVARMIGRASRLKSAALSALIAQGDMAGALKAWNDIIEEGADPFVAIEDVTEWIHQANVNALAPNYFKTAGMTESEINYLDKICGLTVQPALAGAVTMLMDATPGLRTAANGLQTCEMIISRLTSTFARVNKKD